MIPGSDVYANENIDDGVIKELLKKYKPDQVATILFMAEMTGKKVSEVHHTITIWHTRVKKVFSGL